MSHYDEQYEQWDNERDAQNLKTTKEEFKKVTEKMMKENGAGNMRFILNIIYHIEEYKTFFQVLRNKF